MFIFCASAEAKTVEYHLDIALKSVNFSGKDVTAMTVNGGIPGPTLEMTEGDNLVVHVVLIFN